jgi:hypothetical protein
MEPLLSSFASHGFAFALVHGWIVCTVLEFLEHLVLIVDAALNRRLQRRQKLKLKLFR